MAKGDFVGLDVNTLTTMQSQFIACLSAIAGAGQSYSIGGRSFTRADLLEVRNTMAEINYALGRLQGTRTRVTIDNFNPPFGR